jgi:tetratricopeptide (TPR) repeat protein
MREQTMTTKTLTVSAAVLAALLLVNPPAGATAKTAKKTAPKANPEVQKLMSEGLGELQRGEYSAAITALNKAVRKQGSVSTYFLLGWAHYQRGFKQGSVETADRDDAQSAIDAYGMAISMDPKLKELPDASRLYFSLALCDEAVQSYDKSLEAYKSALRLAPNKALIPLNAARLRLKMKDEDKAMSNVAMAMDKAQKTHREGALISAVQKDPAFALLLANRSMRRLLGVAAPKEGTMVATNADFRGEEMRDAVRDTPRASAPAQDPKVLDKIASGDEEFKFRRYQNAVAAYDAALELNSKALTLTPSQIAGLYEKIGTAYNKVGESSQAILSLQKSLQQNPMNAGAHYQIAIAYAMDGKTAAGLHALKECFSSTGDPAELRRYVLLAKTDTELEAVRDLPGFAQASADVAQRVALR